MPAKLTAKSVRGRPLTVTATRLARRPATFVRLTTALGRLTVALALIAATTAVVVSGDSAAAHAAPAGPVLAGSVLAADSIAAVVNNIRLWLMGILAAAATLFATVGFARLMWANGDPGEVEKGKSALRSAAIGYAGALLSPLLVTIVAGWVK